jgi:hypothetical protein
MRAVVVALSIQQLGDTAIMQMTSGHPISSLSMTIYSTNPAVSPIETRYQGFIVQLLDFSRVIPGSVAT